MPGIYPMAFITITISALLGGIYLKVMSGQPRRYLWLLCVSLFLSTVVNLWIKRPLMVGVGEWAGVPMNLGLTTPVWFIVFAWLVAPVTEEAIKVVPLLIPRLRTFLATPVEALWAGVALGLSFGLGEAAYLAWSIAQSPIYAGLPWYTFTGYASERLIVCFGHGMLTALVTAGLQRGVWPAVQGYLAAVALHALINIGPLLLSLDLVSAVVVQLLFIAAIIFLTFIFERLRRTLMQGPDAPDLAQEVVYFKRDQT
jgi:hypothetical protein